MIHFHSVRGQSFNVRQQNVLWGMCMRAVGGRFPVMKNGQIAFHDAFSSSKPRPWNLPGLLSKRTCQRKLMTSPRHHVDNRKCTLLAFTEEFHMY